MLKDEIDNAKRSVNTDTIQISLSEVASMYSQRELDILPDFQRLFRWTDEKKSAFVESVLIGIPIPPVFAFEKDDATWELIDGLQRISTVLEFMGILRDPDDSETLKPPSVLRKTKYLPSLDNVRWEATKDHPNEPHFDKALQLFFRRSRIDFQVLKYPSDPKTKFDLFQRLNRGGAYANEQEVRSCAMVLANPEVTKRIREIAGSEPAEKIFRITGDQKEKQFDVEMVVRAVVHTAIDFGNQTDVQDFLDKGIIEILTGDAPSKSIDSVDWTISILNKLLGDQALIPGEHAGEGLANRFSLRALEAIVVGIARNQESISALGSPDEYLLEKVDEFWKQPEVLEMSAAGLRGTTRLQRTIPFGADWFKPND
jgi:hypothetical protein